MSVCVCVCVGGGHQNEQAEAESTMQSDGGQLCFEQKDRRMDEKRDFKGVYLKWLERSYYCTADLH